MGEVLGPGVRLHNPVVDAEPRTLQFTNAGQRTCADAPGWNSGAGRKRVR